jgi:hypothetical protein
LALVVVPGTSELAIVVVGGTAGFPWNDVVDVAVLGADVAGEVDALAVADLDGAAGGAAKETLTAAEVDDAGGPVEHGSLDVGFGEPGDEGARG